MPSIGKRNIGAGPGRFVPKEKPKNTKETILRLLRIFLRWKRAFFAAAVLTIFSTAATVAAPLFLGRAIGAFPLTGGSLKTGIFFPALAALLSCYLGAWLLDTVNGRLMARLTQNLVGYLREEIYQKFQKIPLPFFDTHPHGDTMSRITNDVDNISTTVSQTTTQFLASLFSILGSVVLMLILNPLLTAVALITIPLFLLLTRSITAKSRPYFTGQQRALGQVGSVVEESISGMRLVKAFRREDEILDKFNSSNDELLRDATRAQIWSGFLMPFMNVINNLSFALLSLVGALFVLNGSADVGTVVSFLAYSKQFGQPLNNVAGMFSNILSALASAERIFEVLDEREETADDEDATVLRDVRGQVDFSHVSFGYKKERDVLTDISFHADPGQVVALVGETGAGKTTIVNLLTRFYETERGDIRIDDKDIRRVTRASLRTCFSVVLQDTFLFTGTISDNIRYARPEATDEEILAAARKARADEFIQKLPDGYKTQIDGNSESLSQGQRQLLAIARAILCEAPILILDEATSSVDTRTEKEIQRAMIELLKNHTCFLIAHRLSTIRDADKIIVIGDGRIQEIGTHRELIRQGGHYAEMVLSQTGTGCP